MTVSSATFKSQYDGDGLTTIFATNFKFLANSDVVVIHRDSSGTETTWTENTEYTLTGVGLDAGGNVTVNTSPTDYTPANNETLTVKRVPTLTQLVSLTLGGPLPSTDIEQIGDRNLMMIQSLQEQVDRAPKLLETTEESAPSMPDMSGLTGNYLVVNAAETGFDLAAPTSGSVITTPVSILQGGTSATTVSAARSALTADPDDLSQDDDMILAIQVFGD